jgi:hypothetical protein
MSPVPPADGAPLPPPSARDLRWGVSSIATGTQQDCTVVVACGEVNEDTAPALEDANGTLGA